MSEHEVVRPRQPAWTKGWKVPLGVLAALVLIPLGCSVLGGDDDGPTGRHVTRSDVTPWPFTVSAGTLRCHPGELVTFEAGGVEYGLNGSATAHYPRPTAIWADDPALGGGLKVSISGAIEAGRALC